MSLSWRISGALLFLATVLPAQETSDELASRIQQLSQGIRPGATSTDAQLSERSAALVQLMRKDPERALSAAWPEQQVTRIRSAATPGDAVESWQDFSGELEVVVADDFERGTSTKEVRLITPTGSLEAHLVGLPETAPCGVAVRAHGIRLGGVIAARVQSVVAAAAACTTVGVQKIVVLLVNFPSAQLPASMTAGYVQDVMFGATSVDKHWQESSYGKVSASGVVLGPFNLSLDYTCNQRDLLRTHAIAAADSQVDFTQYNRIVLILPSVFPCGGGLGTVGCQTIGSADGNFQASTAWIRADFFAPAGLGICSAVHELGHGFGLNHASSVVFGSAPLGTLADAGTRDEYGDRFSLMGLCYSINQNTLLGHYAAQHKAALGWFASSNQQTVQAPGTFTLAPLENNTAALQTIRVQRGPGNDRWLWVEYRQPIGYDATLSQLSSQVFSGALIHYEDPSQPALAGYTQVLDFTAAATPSNFNDPSLAAGASWTDPYTPLRLTVNSATASGLSITVQTDPPCATLSPTSATVGSAASSSSFSVIAPAGCTWTAVSNDSWITITGGSSGSGNGTVFYSVATLPGQTARTGSISAARQTFTITQTGGNSAPTSVSVSPSSGNGATQTFTFAFSDPNGFTDIPWVQMLFNSSLTGLAGCYTHYDRASNVVLLLNAAATGWLGPITLGTSATLQNGQCTVNAVNSSASGVGNNLTVNLNLTFNSSFGGTKNIYLQTVDNSGLASVWAQRGTWTPFSNQAPSTVSVTPASGTGSVQTFTFVYSDANGFTDIPWVQMLFNTTLTGTNACYTHYDRPSNAVSLLNDAGNAFLGPVTVGTVNTVQNSKCIVNARASSASGTGNVLTVNLNLTFKTTFLGTKNVYVQTQDTGGLATGWQMRGTWAVNGPVAPTAVSVTPSSGSGSNQTFSFVFSDANGFGDLPWVQMLVNTSLSGSNACYTHYDLASNSVLLLNDATTAWLGPMTLGTAGTLQNSKCTVNVITSSASGTGTNLTVSLSLSFKAAFAGAKNVYLQTQDTGGLATGWQLKGTWTAP